MNVCQYVINEVWINFGKLQADSGGPLVNMKDELVGIVSWGIP